VFPNTPRKIAGYTRVQDPVVFACQNVHGGVFSPRSVSPGFPPSRE
jgi:hypothetical protein